MVFLKVNGDIFVYYKYAMGMVGIWPQDRAKRVSTIMFWATVTLRMTIVITRLIEQFGLCPSSDVLKGSLYSTHYHVVTILIQISLRSNAPRTVKLIKSMIDDWAIANRVEREIMRKHEKSMFLSIFLGSYVFGSYIIVITTSLLEFANPQLFLKREICGILQTDEFSIILIFILCANLIGNLLSITTSIFQVLLFVTFASYLVAKYEILKNQFIEDLSQTCKNNENRKRFGRLVDNHNRFLGFAKDLEDSFNFSIGLQIIFLHQVGICIRAFQLGVGLKNVQYTSVVKSLLSMFTRLEAFAAICYAGDNVTSYSEDIPKSFGQSNWYELPKSSLIDYSIVASMVHRPKKLTAMKLYNLNLVNFRYICVTTYSFVGILTTLANK